MHPFSDLGRKFESRGGGQGSLEVVKVQVGPVGPAFRIWNIQYCHLDSHENMFLFLFQVSEQHQMKLTPCKKVLFICCEACWSIFYVENVKGAR